MKECANIATKDIIELFCHSLELERPIFRYTIDPNSLYVCLSVFPLSVCDFVITFIFFSSKINCDDISFVKKNRANIKGNLFFAPLKNIFGYPRKFFYFFFREENWKTYRKIQATNIFVLRNMKPVAIEKRVVAGK